jgi:hypothetical protein
MLTVCLGRIPYSIRYLALPMLVLGCGGDGDGSGGPHRGR